MNMIMKKTQFRPSRRGFLGAFALPYLWWMGSVPTFPVEDPKFAEGLAVREVKA